MSNLPAQVDAVVIGSGVAGLAAGVTLAEGGAKVAVFEKERSLGGTSNFFHGMFAVESSLQKKRYITYSRDEAFKNIMDYSHWRANPRLVRVIVNESAGTIDWLQQAGVEFTEATINIPDAPRTYHIIKGKGEAVIKALATRARELGVTVLPATPVKQIIKSGDRVAGVVVEEDEEDIQVAAKAVVIASGGYANNKEWIKKYAGKDLDVNVIPLGNVDKTGDGIRMAFEVGAAEEGLGVLELVRGPVGAEIPMGSHLEMPAVQPDLWVNVKGERFCNEAVGFDDAYVGNASARQPGDCTYSIFDTSIKQQLIENGIEKAMAMDFPPGSKTTGLDRELEAALKNQSMEVFEADSIAELAEKIGIDPAVLKATVEEYNGYCEEGYDGLFTKDPKYLRPIKGPKFYAIRARTVFLGTMGGIKINHNMEVIDKKDNVIPGLYAAGYDAGGMYGDSYSIGNSSGLSSSFATNSGRIAGRNALKYLGR
ncbi:MAG: FAD-dependent oxidoreductase [Dehalococcoidales bacterium]|nr:FAD-dependent oxidoreductase [Dehalococcoidales bacterium]